MPGDKQGLVFISCGQYTPAEIKLGQDLAATIDELTEFRGYFAENQNSLEGLSRNIFDALNRCCGLIAVMHRRGELSTPTGTQTRGSVWVEQEITIAAFLKQAQSRNIQVAVYIQRGIQREGVRDQLHLNPVEFESEDEVLYHFRKRITDGLFSPTLMLEEARRHEKPDVRGSVSDVEVSWYKDTSTEISFKLSVCLTTATPRQTSHPCCS